MPSILFTSSRNGDGNLTALICTLYKSVDCSQSKAELLVNENFQYVSQYINNESSNPFNHLSPIQRLLLYFAYMLIITTQRLQFYEFFRSLRI
ncbi:protein of unknown function [Vibrio tapetis subsp. tapetis]|uniref:Uncharacterized protein n=1 Tax=Vibrio tapetis subsp. tapetis TaxID=1671868 RepID=A0A2N8ZDY6_9VIBR|nr:protein of unknown function [Vibrio tapetis subsp. tapetis]